LKNRILVVGIIISAYNLIIYYNYMNKFNFTKENGLKILRGILISGGAAALTYLATYVANTDFGIYTPAIVAIGGILINAGREFLKK